MKDYRQCRCGAGQKDIIVIAAAIGATGDVYFIKCTNCWHEVVALMFGHYTGPLIDAWNDANRPQGQDNGIEKAMP